MKVGPAVQLFSRTTSAAIRRCYTLGYDIYNAVSTAEFIDLVNNWFEIFNSKIDHTPGKVIISL